MAEELEASSITITPAEIEHHWHSGLECSFDTINELINLSDIIPTGWEEDQPLLSLVEIAKQHIAQSQQDQHGQQGNTPHQPQQANQQQQQQVKGDVNNNIPQEMRVECLHKPYLHKMSLHRGVEITQVTHKHLPHKIPKQEINADNKTKDHKTTTTNVNVRKQSLIGSSA
eukprot:9115584-Ditylum_brightwellii.AAC.1